MENNQVTTYQISSRDQPDSNDRVVLRALIGDPNRYKPQAEHNPPTSEEEQKAVQATMYTLETTHQPIPEKVLPKPVEPVVHFVEPKQAAPPPVEPEVEEAPAPFLEPKVVLEPVFYSIVSAKVLPVHNSEPVIVNVEVIPPMLYTIVGQSQQPIVEKQEPIQAVAPPVVQKTPLFHTAVGQPRLNEVPIKKDVDPNASFYTIVGHPEFALNLEKPEPEPGAPKPPILYNVIGEPNVPREMSAPQKPEPVKPKPRPPILYAAVAQVKLPSKEILATPPKEQPIRHQVVRPIDHTPEPQAPSKAKPEPIAPAPKPKPKQPEPTIPKSETTFIPLIEPVRRHKDLRTAPTRPSNGLIVHRPFTLKQYDPLQLPNYISPYSYHPAQPYKEPTVHPPILPLLRSNKSERQARQQFDSPDNHEEKKFRYDPWTYHSLDRYRKRQNNGRAWDYEGNYPTDPDDNPEEPESNKRKRGRRKARPRTPWEPVW